MTIEELEAENKLLRAVADAADKELSGEHWLPLVEALIRAGYRIKI